MTKSRRIAFIVPFLYRYQRGIERSCAYLANALVRFSHEVTLLTWQERPVKTGFHLHPDIRVFAVPYSRYYQNRVAVPFYAWNLLTHRYGVVNVCFAGYGEAQAIRLARRFHRFQINFIVGYPIEQAPHRFEEFRKLNLEPLLSSIIVKSNAMAPSIANYFGREVNVIPNGVDVSYFEPDKVDAKVLRRQFGFSSDDRVLLTVAALEERKGVQHVIRALPSLIQSGWSAHYLIVGDGPYGQILKSLAKEIGVQDHVHFVGSVIDVRPYYKLADVFCLLSYGEGFPNVLLEAWSMARPVVVSPHPPYPEIVPPAIGIQVDDKNPQAVADVLHHLFSSSAERDQMGVRARRYVESHYAWSTIASQHLAIYESGMGSCS